MLEIRKLHTHYGPSHIIQGIDLTVRDGEVFGIFGRNGVGKTTLLKTIAGWIKPTAGEIEFGGVRIDGLNADRIARRGVGFVPEDRRIFPGLTVEENITLGFLQTPERSAADNRAALQAVYARFPRLSERRAQLGTTLSGGEQQMLAMARVMIGKQNLLLIDEPSEGLRADDRHRPVCHYKRHEAGRQLSPFGRAECASSPNGLRSVRGDRTRHHRAARPCG